MRDRRALVTAAASGLAAGVAAGLAQDGFSHVTITVRNTSAEATLAAIRRHGAQGSAHRVDFSDSPERVAADLERIVESDGPFDTLVHAVGPLVVKRFERLSAAESAELLAANLGSAILTARAVLPAMRERGFGRLVFFGANGSSETRPSVGFAVYGAAKSGVTAFARALALEEARFGITVNVVEPGDIRQKETPRERARTLPGRNPRGRPGSFEDVADVVRFLVAPERDFVTGAVIAVTGGLFEADERNAAPS
jgi:3-oxoacyl-[acyl-carrier protein] reductase